jgi:hypothetical protein
LGFGGYGRRRLRKAMEDERYSKLVYTLDAELLQEKTESKPSRKKKPKKDIHRSINPSNSPVDTLA